MRFRVIFHFDFRISYEADLIEESSSPGCPRRLVADYPKTKIGYEIGELAHIFDEFGNLLYSPRDEKNLQKLSSKNKEWILKNHFWIPVWKSPYLEITKAFDIKEEPNQDLI